MAIQLDPTPTGPYFAHCLACPHYDVGLCCGCWLDAKVRLPHEACPEGRWKAEEQAG